MPPEEFARSQMEILALLKEVQETFRESQIELSSLSNRMNDRDERYDKQFSSHQLHIDKLYTMTTEASATVGRLEGEIKSFIGRFDRIDDRQTKVAEKVFALDKKLIGYLALLTGIVMAIDKGGIGALLKVLAP